MQLKKLSLSGFKSFAKAVTLEFPFRISAIVGPNGSGKSNVAEAVAWVLGEQSIKYLRGKKGEDLIFNGSASAAKMGKASVTLVFSENLKEDEETSVSRTVYRDGENEYFINESRCRLKDIIEFLSKMGLGTSRHHIISQGESDRILAVSSKERREMVEDALGLRGYQLKKEESLRKLLKTGENIKQAESLRKEIQPHLKFLKKQVEKAQQVFVLQEKLRNLYSSYFSKTEIRLRADSDNLNLRRSEAESSLFLLEKGAEEAGEQLGAFLKEKEKIQKTREEIGRLEREIGRYEGMLSRPQKPFSAQERKKEERTFLNLKEVEGLTISVNESIDRALLQTEIENIKIILSEIKHKLAEFVSEYKKEKLEEKKEEKNVDGHSELEKKYGELTVLLAAAKNEEIRLNAENEKSLQLERELYQKEIQKNELQNRLKNLMFEEEEIRLRKTELDNEKMEARALIKEDIDIILQTAGEVDKNELTAERREIERFKIKLEESGNVGEEILKEYRDVQTRDEFLDKEMADLVKTSESLKELINQLEEKMTNDFEDGVLKINQEFQKFFETMFGGGRAELKIVKQTKVKKEEGENVGELPEEEQEKESEEGLEMSVSLPKKRIKSLDLLSGGERALASIALLFAVSQVNPPPFLVLDETDAALDESNSRKYAKMLQGLSKTTQLILVTHNRETMNVAGVLYGVTMGSDGISRLLSVKLEEAGNYAR